MFLLSLLNFGTPKEIVNSSQSNLGNSGVTEMNSEQFKAQLVASQLFNNKESEEDVSEDGSMKEQTYTILNIEPEEKPEFSQSLEDFHKLRTDDDQVSGEIKRGASQSFIDNAEKTEEISQGLFSWMGTGLWGAAKGATNFVAQAGLTAVKYTAHVSYDVTTGMIQRYLEDFRTHKNVEILEAKKQMRETLGDEQFISLFELVESFSEKWIEQEVNAQFETTPMLKDIVGDATLISDIIHINLATGFTNLAKQLNENKDKIPNFANQPMWMNAIFLCYLNAGESFNTQALKEIEQKHKEQFADLEATLTTVLPKEKNVSDEAIQQLIHLYIGTNDYKVRTEVLSQLFPEELVVRDAVTGHLMIDNADIKEVIEKLDALAPVQTAINDMLGKLVDGLMGTIFPNKLNDLTLPGALKTNVLGMGSVADLIYSGIRGIAATKLNSFYHAQKKDFDKTLSFVEMIKSPQYVDLFELDKQRALLNEKCNGSTFLSEMAKAISDDVITTARKKITSDLDITAEIFQSLGHENPSAEEIQSLNQAIQLLIPELGRKNLSAVELQAWFVDVLSSRQEKLSFSDVQVAQLIETFVKLQKEGKNLDQTTVSKAFSEMVANLEGSQEDKEAFATFLQDHFEQFAVTRGTDKLSADDLARVYIQTRVVENEGEILPLKTIQKHKLDTVLIKLKTSALSEEKLFSKILAIIPKADTPELRAQFNSQIHGILKGEASGFEKNTEIVQKLVEGILLKVLTNVASANPSVEGKTTDVIIVEKLKTLLADGYKQIAAGESSEVIVNQMVNQLMTSVLNVAVLDEKGNLVASEEFNWLPIPLQNLVLNNLQKPFRDYLDVATSHFSKIQSTSAEIQAVKMSLKKFDATPNSNQKITSSKPKSSNTETVISDLITMIIPSTFDFLTHTQEESARAEGVVTIAQNLEQVVEEFANNHYAFAKVLLKQANTPAFKEMIESDLNTLAAPGLESEKAQISEVLTNLILSPANTLLSELADFGHEADGQNVQKVMGHIFEAAAKHINTLNLARKIATDEGREMLHSDFIKAGEELGGVHPALPRGEIAYTETLAFIKKALAPRVLSDIQVDTLRSTIKTMISKERTNTVSLSMNQLIDTIKTVLVQGSPIEGRLTEGEITALNSLNENNKSLKDLIHYDANSLNMQRKTEAFDPASRFLINHLFPNGLNDLTFIKPQDRAKVWNLLENNLLPIVMPIIMDFFSRDTMETVLLSSIESTVNSLNQKVKGQLPQDPVPYTESEVLLGKMTGSMTVALINRLQLPDAVKSQLLQSSGDEVVFIYQDAVGRALVNTFNGEFVENTIKTALDATAARDSKGNFALKYDSRPEAVRKKEAIKNQKLRSKKTKRAIRQLFTTGISFGIRTAWANFHAKFNQKIMDLFPWTLFDVNVALALKKSIDAIGRLIFFTLIGNVLKVTLWPAKRLFQEIMYRYLSMEENTEAILGMFGDKPKDQPAGYKNPVYNENFIYEAVQAAFESSKDFIHPEQDLGKVK